MRTIEEEAKFIFGDLETGIGAERRRIWLWGATSKQVEAEKIKAKIEAVNHFCKLSGVADNSTHKSVIGMYEQQLKELEDEQ